jgi:hypothetical protein
MKTKRQRLLHTCMIKENGGKPLPKGQGLKARRERCVLAVKCQNKQPGRRKRQYNPWAVCNASVY